MNVLAIDTTGPYCAVAVRQPGCKDVIYCERIGRGHAERLAPMVQLALSNGALSPCQLDRIAVTTGPGSFAGTRVGIAFARGLSLATGAQLVGLSNMAWWAAETSGDAYIVHDAKRGEVVIQAFRQKAPRSEARLISLIDAKAKLKGQSVFGSGAALLDGSAPSFPEPNMARLLDLAISADGASPAPKPFYARPPDAKLPGGSEPE